MLSVRLALLFVTAMMVLDVCAADGYGHGGHGHSSHGIGTACIVKVYWKQRRFKRQGEVGGGQRGMYCTPPYFGTRAKYLPHRFSKRREREKTGKMSKFSYPDATS